MAASADENDANTVDSVLCCEHSTNGDADAQTFRIELLNYDAGTNVHRVHHALVHLHGRLVQRPPNCHVDRLHIRHDFGDTIEKTENSLVGHFEPAQVHFGSDRKVQHFNMDIKLMRTVKQIGLRIRNFLQNTRKSIRKINSLAAVQLRLEKLQLEWSAYEEAWNAWQAAVDVDGMGAKDGEPAAACDVKNRYFIEACFEEAQRYLLKLKEKYVTEHMTVRLASQPADTFKLLVRLRPGRNRIRLAGCSAWLPLLVEFDLAELPAVQRNIVRLLHVRSDDDELEIADQAEANADRIRVALQLVQSLYAEKLPERRTFHLDVASPVRRLTVSSSSVKRTSLMSESDSPTAVSRQVKL